MSIARLCSSQRKAIAGSAAPSSLPKTRLTLPTQPWHVMATFSSTFCAGCSIGRVNTTAVVVRMCSHMTDHQCTRQSWHCAVIQHQCHFYSGTDVKSTIAHTPDVRSRMILSEQIDQQSEPLSLCDFTCWKIRHDLPPLHVEEFACRAEQVVKGSKPHIAGCVRAGRQCLVCDASMQLIIMRGCGNVLSC